MPVAAYNSAYHTLTVVRRKADAETVRVLEELLMRARDGEILGVAVVAITGLKEYELMTTGGAQDRPTFTLGALTKFKLMVADTLGE